MCSQFANVMQYLANMAERFKTPGSAVRLGMRMRIARKGYGFTLSDVSQRTGVDAGQISKMERGKMATLSRNVQKVCKLLDVPTTMDDPSSRASRMLDNLIAEIPGSESAVVKLIAAIEEVILGGTRSTTSKRLD